MSSFAKVVSIIESAAAEVVEVDGYAADDWNDDNHLLVLETFLGRAANDGDWDDFSHARDIEARAMFAEVVHDWTEEDLSLFDRGWFRARARPLPSQTNVDDGAVLVGLCELKREFSRSRSPSMRQRNGGEPGRGLSGLRR